MTVDGSTSYPPESAFNPSDGQYTGTRPIPWNYAVPSNGNGYVNNVVPTSSTSKSGVTATVRESGLITAVFVWYDKDWMGRPDGSSPTPYVYVEVTCTASARGTTSYPAGSGPNPEDSVQVQANNGFAVAQPSTTLTNNDLGRTSVAEITTTRLLQQASGGSNRVSVSLPPLTAQITVKVPSPSGSSASFSTSVTYTVKRGSRGVQISSDIEPSYFKSFNVPPPGTPPGTLGPFPAAPEANKRNPDGSMSVDKVATRTEGTVLDDGGQYVPITRWYGGGVFTANAVGFTSPTYSWDVASNMGVYTGAQLTLVDYVQSNPFGPKTLTLGTGAVLPIRSTVIAVSVTDGSDSAKGKNTYTVNWHMPFEAYQEIADPAQGLPKVDTRYYDGDVTSCDVGAGNNINADGSPVIFTIHKTLLGTAQDYVQGGIQLLQIPAALASPGWNMVLAALTQAGPLDDGDEQPSTTQNSSDMFNSAKDLGLVPQTAVFDQWNLTKPFQYVRYNVKLKRGDTYGPNGWTGTDDRIIAEKFAGGASGQYRKISLNP